MDQAVLKVLQTQSNIWSLHLPRDPLQDVCDQTSLGVQKLKADPYIIAAVREATFPNLTFHFLSSLFFPYFSPTAVAPAWLFLPAEFPGMNRICCVAKGFPQQ